MMRFVRSAPSVLGSSLFTGLLLLSTAMPTVEQDKVGTTAAPFLSIGMGARAGALGESYVAIAEGPSALYWNPAGVADMTRTGAEFSYLSWFVDSNIQQAALVIPLAGFGNLGIHVVTLGYGEMEVTTISNPDGTGELFSPRDLSAGLSFARNLTDRFAIGGTFKLVTQRIWNSTASGAALDLGVLYRTGFRNLRIAASMANFGQDLRLSGKDLRVAQDIDPTIEGNNPRLPANLEVDPWAMPLTFRIGVAADVVSLENQRLTTTVDALHPNDNSESANFGVEYAFSELLFLRGGYRQAFAAESDDGGFTLGAGLQYDFGNGPRVRFDYVYQQYQGGRLESPQMYTFGVDF
jgi:opacity protein-like surface antigen